MKRRVVIVTKESSFEDFLESMKDENLSEEHLKKAYDNIKSTLSDLNLQYGVVAEDTKGGIVSLAEDVDELIMMIKERLAIREWKALYGSN